jgi:hypothetical protein
MPLLLCAGEENVEILLNFQQKNNLAINSAKKAAKK